MVSQGEPTGQQLLIWKMLQEFDLPPDMGTFECRHNKQKLFSWLTHEGLRIGHRFRWYIHGPYSPELAGDLFFIAENQAHVQQAADRIRVSPEFEQKIQELREKIGGKIHDKAFMETLGSMAFLKDRGVPSGRLVEELRLRKPHLAPPIKDVNTSLLEDVATEFFLES